MTSYPYPCPHCDYVADSMDSNADSKADLEHQHADRWPCVCGATYDEWKAAQPAPEEGCSSCGLYGGGHAHPDCEGAQPAPEAATVEEKGDAYDNHDRRILEDADAGRVDKRIVVVRCPHRIGLAYQGSPAPRMEDDWLMRLPCPCNDRSEVVATVEPVTDDTEALTKADEALSAWERKGPTSLTVALVVEALHELRESVRRKP